MGVGPGCVRRPVIMLSVLIELLISRGALGFDTGTEGDGRGVIVELVDEIGGELGIVEEVGASAGVNCGGNSDC